FATYYTYTPSYTVTTSLFCTTPYHPSLSTFFFNATATTGIYTLSLHDALPICCIEYLFHAVHSAQCIRFFFMWRYSSRQLGCIVDRKSTRLNSSHVKISYAVFCLKKKKKRPA